MGNAKSLNRADIAKCVEDNDWACNADTLNAIHEGLMTTQKQSKAKKSKQDGRLCHHEIDAIHDLVLSLKKGGKEGQDLLEQFIEKQAELKDEVIPIEFITLVENQKKKNGESRRQRTSSCCRAA